MTLRQIAERAGCTRSTVSLALRNHPHVAAKTRQHVQTIARQLGWTPNAGLAQHMALVRGTGTRRAMPNLGVLVNLPKEQLAAEGTPPLHLEGAVTRAEALGYGVSVINLGEQSMSAPRLRQVLKARGVTALVYVATASRPFPTALLGLGEGFATSFVGWRCNELPYHVARSNQFVNSQTAVAAVHARGSHRPSAVIPDLLDRLLKRSYSGGVLAGQRELPVQPAVPPLVIGVEHVYIPDASFGAVRSWVVEHRPDAVLTTDVRSLVRCFAGWSPGFPCPRLYSLDYHAGEPVAGGMDEHGLAVGAAGVDLAVAQLHRGEVGVPKDPYTLEVEGHWVDVAESPSGGTPARRSPLPR